MSESGGEDRTEAATPRRLQRAREQGQVAVSRELTTAAALGAGLVALIATAPASAPRLAAQLLPFFGDPAFPSLDGSGVETVMLRGLGAVALAAGPVMGAALAGSLVATLGQSGFSLSFARLMPRFGSLNPLQGLRRVAGPQRLLEAAKSAVKIAAFGLLFWRVAAIDLPLLSQAVFWPAPVLATEIAHEILRIGVFLVAAQALVAAVDVVLVRRHHAASMRMSREEVKQESKENDGNPHVKGRQRALRRSRRRRRMLAAVPKAAVVITNPTHYAVALAYENGTTGAPRVVAKGMDEVAARIREVAREHRVPVIANPPLARALHEVDLEAEIPQEQFRAVAEVIAYVWRLRSRAAFRP